MGTHPIFESDFDCLTDLLECLKLSTKPPKKRKISRPSQEMMNFSSSILFSSKQLSAPVTLSKARATLTQRRNTSIPWRSSRENMEWHKSSFSVFESSSSFYSSCLLILLIVNH